MKFWATVPFFYRDMERPWRELLAEQIDLAQAAEDLGFEGITIPENHFQNYLTNPSALAFASAVAVRTKRLKIKPGVIVLPYYHPLLVASEVGLLDSLAPGRVSIGVARGGSRYQFDRIGVNPDDARGMYEEALEIIKRAWVEDDFRFEGRYYSFPETTIVPKPDTKPYPALWVAAQSIEGIRKVAEEGYNLVTSTNYGNFEPHGDLELLIRHYNEAAATSGYPRGEVMVMRHVWLAESEQEALKHFDKVVDHWNHYMAVVQGGGAKRGQTREQRLARRTEGATRDFVRGGRIIPETNVQSPENLFETFNDPIMTTPDRVIDRFRHYEKLGIDHLDCHQGMGMPVDEVIANMELMASEVFPAFEQNSTD